MLILLIILSCDIIMFSCLFIIIVYHSNLKISVSIILKNIYFKFIHVEFAMECGEYF